MQIHRSEKKKRDIIHIEHTSSDIFRFVFLLWSEYFCSYLPSILVRFVHASHRNWTCSKTQQMILARGSSEFSRYYSPVLTNGRLFRIKSLARVWFTSPETYRCTYTNAMYRSTAYNIVVYASFCERSRSLSWKRPFLGALPRPQIRKLQFLPNAVCSVALGTSKFIRDRQIFIGHRARALSAQHTCTRGNRPFGTTSETANHAAIAEGPSLG